MSQAALNATIGRLQGAVRARLANEEAFKVRVYDEINLILARLRECAVVVANAPPGPASAAAVVDLNREIAALTTEIGNLENPLLDENDVGDVTGTLARQAPNLRFDTQENMQRFARAPPAYVTPGPRAPRPLASSSVAVPGVLGALSGPFRFGSPPRRPTEEEEFFPPENAEEGMDGGWTPKRKTPKRKPKKKSVRR